MTAVTKDRMCLAANRRASAACDANLPGAAALGGNRRRAIRRRWRPPSHAKVTSANPTNTSPKIAMTTSAQRLRIKTLKQRLRRLIFGRQHRQPRHVMEPRKVYHRKSRRGCWGCQASTWASSFLINSSDSSSSSDGKTICTSANKSPGSPL